MLTSLALPVMILCVVAAWTTVVGFSNAQHTQYQLRALQRGLSARATVVGLQRPFLLDPYTRIYFEFVPAGTTEPIRCCHVDRRTSCEVAMTLPVIGGQVQVSYLPEDPANAVIGQLFGLAR